MKHRRNSVLIIVCMLVIAGIDGVPILGSDFLPEMVPPWLRVGTYVEYQGGSPVGFLFIDGREMFLQEDLFIFRWDVAALSGHVATLNITLHIPLKMPSISRMVNITVNTREILGSNGTVLGKTCLWLPPNLKEEDRVVVSGKLPNEVTAEVTHSGGSSTLTCQGYQELYVVHNSTEIVVDNRYAHKLVDVHAYFDLDTGLFLHGFIDYTTTVNCLGLREMSLIRFLRATNVDLGPRYLRSEIGAFLNNTLPIWLPSIFFITAVVVMIRRRRKRRSPKQTKNHFNH